MQDRGPAAYIAEFLGTMFLVFFITAAVSLFVVAPTPQTPIPYIDFGIIGMVHFLALFLLVQGMAIVSGAHFNPAVTFAMTALRQIKPSDAVIYIVAQIAGAIVGALLTKWLMSEFANAEAVNYGAPAVSDFLDGKTTLGMLAEFIGVFLLVLTIVAVAVDPRVDRALAPLAIGAALGLGAFVFAPLTGAALNPARAIGPALVSGEWGPAGQFILVYLVAPLLAAVVAAIGYMNLLVTPGAKDPDTLEPVG
jgi:MIP family channel proteins